MAARIMAFYGCFNAAYHHSYNTTVGGQLRPSMHDTAHHSRAQHEHSTAQHMAQYNTEQAAEAQTQTHTTHDKYKRAHLE